jgi:hypothetical protein
MERRIASIIRWLERCLAARRAGFPENALMDAECAQAEMDRLRDELWKDLKTRHTLKRGVRASSVPLPVRALLWGAVAVLAAATPLAFEKPDFVKEEPGKGEAFSLEWVTPDEKTLLGNLRKRLSAGALALTSDSAEAGKDLVLTARRAAAKPAAGAPKTPVKPSPEKLETRPDPERADFIPYDHIITLVRTGESALKKQEPLIRVER